MIVVCRNGRERHYLEQLKRELATFDPVHIRPPDTCPLQRSAAPVARLRLNTSFISQFGSVTIRAFGCPPRRELVLRTGAVDLRFASNSNHRGQPQMKTAIVKTLTVGVAALIVATATGCTSKDTLARIDAANAAAKAAAQDAAAAKSAADAASAAASSASNAASAAQSTASQALQAAQGAQACCDATNEKIDRAFQKSMGK
jgi:hypothetical protein